MTDQPATIDDLIRRWEHLRQEGQSIQVEELCRDYPDLIDTVRERIDKSSDADPRAHEITIAMNAAEMKREVPVQINGYVILEVLGRGGMGVVYKARQGELGRIVALKFLLAGVHASEQDRERFRHEAEVLAKLRHPGIVQIFEIGATPEGTYLVLEYMQGGSLSERLDGKPWPTQPAAQFVEQISEAVEVAHNAGIVHRDLKPANILLSTGKESWRRDTDSHRKNDRSTAGKDDGSTTPPITPSAYTTETGELSFLPKITDFGIAKRLYSESGLTASGAIVGTPAYMSPEQASGRSRDTGPSSDVYSLGAILYELLTGRPPFIGVTPIETLMQVQFTDPVPPSRLNPQVPRDLETVCLKCLEKDPVKRYRSAALLADDLRHVLKHQPIVAHPPGTIARLVKWARRNPSRAALVGTLFIAMLAAIAGGVLHTLSVRAERDRAERNVELATQAVDELLTEVAEEHLALEPRMEEKRRVLLEKALAFYEKLQAENADNPKLRRQTALGQKRLADIQRLLRRFAEAEPAYRRAIERLDALVTVTPDDWELQRALADSHNFLGETLRKAGRLAEARDEYQTARRLQEALGQRRPSPEQRLDLARSQYNLGLVSTSLGQLESANGELSDAVARLRSLAEEFPSQPVYQQHLARSLFNLGKVLRQKGELKGAIDSAREAISRLDVLRLAYPLQPDYQHELGVARINLGNYYQADLRLNDAEKEHRAATDHFRNLVRDFPRTPDYQSELANALNSLGVSLAKLGKLGDAQTCWEESARLLDQLIADGRADVATHGVLANARGNLGRLHLLSKNYTAARMELVRSLDQLQAALKVNPDEPDYLNTYRARLKDLAEALVRTDAIIEALERARTIEASFERPQQGRRFATIFLARCLYHIASITKAALVLRALHNLTGRMAKGEIAECCNDPDLAGLFERPTHR